MLQNRSLNSVNTMNTSCFKDRERQKKILSRLIFLFAGILFSITLSAQITFAEKIEKKPDWDYLRDAIMAPYDSMDVCIQPYPLLEAYKKYIGQRLFFMKYSVYLHSDTKDGYIIDKSMDDGWSIMKDNRKDAIHKYYDIIDVIGADKSPFSHKIGRHSEYRYIPENKKGSTNFRKDHKLHNVSEDNQPCFILKDIQSCDTLYLYVEFYMSGFPPFKSRQSFILVGGFMKLKETMIGQDFIYYGPSFRSGYGREAIRKSVWQCIDVSIATDDYFQKYNSSDKVEKEGSDEEQLAFVLRNKKDASIIPKCPLAAHKIHLFYTVANFGHPTSSSNV